MPQSDSAQEAERLVGSGGCEAGSEVGLTQARLGVPQETLGRIWHVYRQHEWRVQRDMELAPKLAPWAPRRAQVPKLRHQTARHRAYAIRFHQHSPTCTQARESMKFAMKEALVLTIPDGGDGPDRWRLSSRFVFYIDTDAKKIAFIDWYLTKIQDCPYLNLHFAPFRQFIVSGCAGFFS